MNRKKITTSVLSLSVALSSLAGSIAPAMATTLPVQAQQSAKTGTAINYDAYGENLALNKTCTASSIEANSVRAELATDGSMSTHWGSGTTGGPDWLCVDLGESKEIGLVRIRWESQKADNYKVQVADTMPSGDEGWTDVYTSDTWPSSLDDNIVLDEAVSGRYVRVLIPSYSADDHGENGIPHWNSISIFELEVYGPKDENYQDPAENVALHKTAVASSQEASSVRAENAVDGDTSSPSSRWGSNLGNGPDWIYVDLGKTMNVRTVRVFWENRKATAYSIQLAQEGADVSSASAWEDAYVSNDRPAKLEDQIELSETKQARYVRLYIPSHTSEDPDGGVTYNTVSIYELEVYGGQIEKAASCQDALDAITVEAPKAGDTQLSYRLPETNGITVTYNGTDFEQIIGRDGAIHTPIVDKDVKASFKAVNDKTGEVKFKEFTLTIPGQYTVEENDNAALKVLPELQEWKGQEGTYAITESTRVVYTDDAFKNAAEQLAADYAEMKGTAISAVKGTAAEAAAGDIVFVKNTDSGLGKEGSLMTIADKITVEAEENTGAYWATRTILQAVMNSADGAINQGIARDYPLYETRGLILDVGRKTFTMDYLKQIVKMMSWYKLNDFQVHLNDNYIPIEEYIADGSDPYTAYHGFRLESDIKEGGNGGLNKKDLTSKDMFYTKAEFRDFIKESRELGVNIVPEFDTPAHSLALTNVRPDLSVAASDTINIRRPHDHLNLSEKYDECLEFVQSIFSEYITEENPVFDEQTTLHIGADEYEASSVAYRKYVNDMIEFVENTGRKARVWGSFTQLSQGEKINAEGVEINIWNNGWANMDKMYKDGFDLINCVDGQYYIVPNATYYYDYLNDNTVYNGRINQAGGAETYVPAGDAQMKGGAFAVWNDMCDRQENGMSEYDIYDRISRAAGLYGANAWGKGSATTAEAKELASGMLANIPGTNFNYTVDSKTDTISQITMDSKEDLSGNGYGLITNDSASIAVTDYKKALKLEGGASYAELEGLSTIGLGNDLRVKVKRSSASGDDQILFESKYGSIKAVQGKTGKVGITRENHDYSFEYELPVGQWVELEFKNEFEKTHLYVNGKYVDTIGGGSRGQLKATCMLPVGIVGSMTNAFEGYVDDIRISKAADFNSTMALDEKVLLANSVNTDGSLDAAIAAANAVINKAAPTAAEISSAIADLDAALSGMEYEKADYSKVDRLLALVPEDLSVYTSDSAQALERAVANITRNLPAALQESVDGMAASLESALLGLEVNTNIDVTLVDRSIMTATASSQETGSEDNKASNAIDGNTSTIWHTDWNDSTPPHWLQIEFDTPQTISSVLYTPRSGAGNGTALGYTIQVSDNGTDFTDVKSGTLARSAAVKTIDLDAPVTAKFVRFVITDGVGGFGSAAEIAFVKGNVEANVEGLNALITKAEALRAADYTAESWSALQSAVTSAKALAASENPDANEVEVEIGKLGKAIAALQYAVQAPDPEEVDKELLRDAVEYARTLSTEGVNELVVKQFEAALRKAEAVLASSTATQDEVDSAWAELTHAIHMMDFTTDKSELQALYDELSKLNLDLYEDGAEKDAFVQALENAAEVLANPAVLTEESIARAIEALNTTKDALIPRSAEEIDTRLLQLVYDQASAEDLDRYIDAGKEEFTAALNEARDVLANPQSAAQVAETTSKLHTAWLNLRLKADEALLRELVSFVEDMKAINRSLFTPEELSRIDAAAHKVELALENNEKKSPELDSSAAKKLAAEAAEIKELVNSRTGAPAGNTGTSDKKTPSSVNESVKTSAASMAGGWMSAMAVAGLALAAAFKRRNKK